MARRVLMILGNRSEAIKPFHRSTRSRRAPARWPRLGPVDALQQSYRGDRADPHGDAEAERKDKAPREVPPGLLSTEVDRAIEACRSSSHSPLPR